LFCSTNASLRFALLSGLKTDLKKQTKPFDTTFSKTAFVKLLLEKEEQKRLAEQNEVKR